MHRVSERCKCAPHDLFLPTSHIHQKTVGTLLSYAYVTGGCLLGAIFGTGTNGAFVEKTSSFTKLGSGLSEIKSEYMVVNTEWGAFDNEVSTSVY